MNKILHVFLIIMIPVLAISQQKEYKSKEQEEYYKQFKFNPRVPVSVDKILNYKNDFFSFEEISDFSEYSDSLNYTAYQDLIFSIMVNVAKDDSMIFPEPQYIGGIEKSNILKHGKSEQSEAFIYTSYKYEDIFTGEPGIWVSISENNGASWEYLYTGIVQRQPLYVKWYSKAPLIKSDSVLQVEAALLRQLTPNTHPLPGPTYEIVKDKLVLFLDLNTLRKDTDADGLTDIVEAKLYTDPEIKDTNGNGIPDNVDLNPRFSVPRTDRTVIYEWILNNEITLFDTMGVFISSHAIPQTNFATDTTETILIVTDNPDIQSVQPASGRVIILTENEYKQQDDSFDDELNSMRFSPMFKVDKETDTYILERSFNLSGEEYLIKKTENGWIIKIISFWIS